MNRLLMIALFVWAPASGTSLLAAAVKVYPTPPGEELSSDYTVQVEGQDTPVYVAKVAPADPQARWKAMDDKKNSADFFEKASFTYFDFEGTVRIQITCPRSGPLGQGPAILVRHQTVHQRQDDLDSTGQAASPDRRDQRQVGRRAAPVRQSAGDRRAPPGRSQRHLLRPWHPRSRQSYRAQRQDGLCRRRRGRARRDQARREVPHQQLQRAEDLRADLRAEGREHRLPRTRDRGRQPLHHARAEHAGGPRPGHPDRRRDPARLQHLDDPHPPVRPRDGQERQAARLPRQLGRHRHLQQPRRDGGGLLHPHARRPDRGEVGQRPGRSAPNRGEELRAVERGGPRAEHRRGTPRERGRRAVHRLRRHPRPGPRVDAARVPLRFGAHQQHAVREHPHRGDAAADLAYGSARPSGRATRPAGTSTTWSSRTFGRSARNPAWSSPGSAKRTPSKT